MKSVVVLQARTDSSRLPAKVLLPIKGLPIVVLAAKRAGNTGRDVIVATSTESSDDCLAATLAASGLQYYRGSLQNTLNRLVSSLSEFHDDDIVFRLTADNVFPDGAFLDEMQEEFVEKELAYLCSNGISSGLPYGMSVEVTRLRHLREAEQNAVDSFDREHVTPYIRRKFGSAIYTRHGASKREMLRCTIDCLDDFLSVSEVFSNIDDIVHESAFNLIEHLEKCRYQPMIAAPVSKLVLGAAQLGLPYGITNIKGQPEPHEAEKLIKTAISNGVQYIDTARAYGNSEEIIGKSLSSGWQGRVKVITKLSPMSDCLPDASGETIRASVDASIYQSCVALGYKVLDVLMVHRASHLTDWQGTAWARLMELKKAGRIGQLGVSVQSPDELKLALSFSDVQYIQIPCNLLDWRWDNVAPHILATKRARELTVHARSAFLQGLLLSQNESHWRHANVANPDVVIAWLANQVKKYKRVNTADLCVSYLNSLPWIDGVAVGMEIQAQLNENVFIFSQAPLAAEEVENLRLSRPKLNEDTLNPSLWKKCHEH